MFAQNGEVCCPGKGVCKDICHLKALQMCLELQSQWLRCRGSATFKVYLVVLRHGLYHWAELNM